MENYFLHRFSFIGPFVWFTPLILLELILKGFALWKAARNNQRNWYIALLIVSSAGVLPTAYLLFFQKKTK